MRLMRSLILIAPLALAGLLAPAAEKAPTFPADHVAFYEKQVLPILKEHCFKCHAEKKARGGLRLDSRSAILKGGDLGPAAVPGKPDASTLVKAVRSDGDLRMPPAGKLPREKIDVLARWVEMNLPYSSGKDEIVTAPAHKGHTITQEDRDWWAYRPRNRPALPAIKATTWVRNPIDAFVLAKLEEKGLRPAGEADRVALIRRVTYDLTGLPPTPAEVDAFLQDSRPGAYERLVDRLLASPAYGEKWGRHWLDLVRFAETNGYERDGTKPFAWRYRDYVIASLNADKPYDRFVREQLAGDELAPDEPEPVIATGYYRLGLWDDEPADSKQARADEIDDWVSTTGQVFLAMTLNCARCHDHKKDPIAQADYYRLAAFFEDVRHFSMTRDPRSNTNLTDITPLPERVKYAGELSRRESRKAELAEAMRKIEDEVIKRMPADEQRAAESPLDRPAVLKKMMTFLKPEEAKQYKKLRGERMRLERLPSPARDLALSVNNCLARPPATHVMIRGNPHALGAKVEPGFPSVFAAPDPKIAPAPPDARTSGRRSVLAGWVASKDNPLTARVLANRLWQYHFGRGIVPSASDFGKLGEMPTHPELLDWLAGELMAGDWALKRMHRLIVTSATYRLSSRAHPEGLAKDPANTLLWRFSMRRLTAEEVRDSMLSVTGELNRRMAGPGVYPTIPAAVLAGQSMPGSGWGKSPPEEQARRSVYVHVKRSLIVPILQTHDLADTDSSCPVRYTTTVPTQALGLLNGAFTNEQAAALAGRIAGEAEDVTDQVRLIIRLTTGREPGGDEVAKDVAFVRKMGADGLRLYCLLALNSNEFMYLD
jgi:mono/diheme cytochrome c family protein